MAADPFVIDASALALRFLDEAPTRAFRAWLDRRLLAESRLLAPDLIRYELASVVFKNFRTPAHRRDASLLVDLVRDATEGVELHEEAWARTWKWAGRLSAYDAAYLALAETTQATLVTYDATLSKVARTVVPVLGIQGLPAD